MSKAEADQAVENALYHRAIGFSHTVEEPVMNAKTGEVLKVEYRESFPPDTTAGIFWLKNRKPREWRDRHDLHLGPLLVDDL
jgi:hypothetical protein